MEQRKAPDCTEEDREEKLKAMNQLEREARKYFAAKNEYINFEKTRLRPVSKSPQRVLKDAAVAELRKRGIFGGKDYGFITLAGTILDKSFNDEKEAIQQLNSWYLEKLEEECEYKRKKRPKSTVEPRKKKSNAKGCAKSKTPRKSQYNHILWGRTYPDGKGGIITEIIQKPYDPESGKIIEC